MLTTTIERLNNFFEDNPIAKGVPTNESEIREAEEVLNIKFDSDYISFQTMYGGSMIKATEVYGFHNSELMSDDNIIDLTKSYRENEDGDISWLIIGTDYSGNSIGIDENGKVLVYDHDLEELHYFANSFEEYILKALE
jgi:hypothetical protein